jgi:antitoxin (DNA-binding transcriptional repressor) of toxin-antitoxin stability system
MDDVLVRIRYRGDSFLIERNGEPVARIVPLDSASPASVRESLAAWSSVGPPDDGFAADLERVEAEDREPENS